MPRGTPPEAAAGSPPRPERHRPHRRAIAFAALGLAGLAFGSLVASAALSVGGPRPAQSASPRVDAADSDTSYLAFGVEVARDGSPEPPTPTPTPSPTPTPPAGATSPAGLSVWADGDSTSYFVSLAFCGLLTDLGATIARCDDYKINSGLVAGGYSAVKGYPFAGWLAQIPIEMAAYDPDIVMFMIGANDWGYHDYDDYRSRVASLMDSMYRPGRLVAWVGMPGFPCPSPDSSTNACYLANTMPALNAIFAEEAAKRPWVHFVDATSVMPDAIDYTHFSGTSAAMPVARLAVDALFPGILD